MSSTRFRSAALIPLAAIAALPLLPPASTAWEAAWENLGTPGPRGRIAVTDTRRHRVLFLGPGAANGDSVVWEFDPALPQSWRMLNFAPAAAHGVPAFLEAQAAYDSLHDRVLVVEGVDLPGYWVLSLSGVPGWRYENPWGDFVTPDLPAPRSWFSLIWDPPRGQLVMYGGVIFTTQPGVPASFPTWEVWTLVPFDTTKWKLKPPDNTAPPNRSAHTAIYDPSRSRMAIFGGTTLAGNDTDVWALDLAGPANWTRITSGPTRPSRGSRAFGAYDPARDRLLAVTPGASGVEVWEADLEGVAGWRSLRPELAGPGPRSGYAAAFDPWLRTLVLHGGSAAGNVVFQDAWRLYRDDPEQRSAVAGPATALPGATVVRWSVGSDEGVRLRVERRTGSELWLPVAEALVPPDREIEFTDAGARPGATHHYRLAVAGSGLLLSGSEVAVEVPDRSTLHVYAVRPQPTRGPLELDLLAPAAGELRADLYDLGGRRVRSTRLSVPAPGRVRLRAWDDLGLPAGVYLLRVTQGVSAATHRVVAVP